MSSIPPSAPVDDQTLAVRGTATSLTAEPIVNQRHLATGRVPPKPTGRGAFVRVENRRLRERVRARGGATSEVVDRKPLILDDFVSALARARTVHWNR